MKKRKRKEYVNAIEARSSDYDLAEENAVQKHVFRACEKGIKMKMPFARTTVASFLGFCGAVGTAGTGLDWDVRCRCSYWMALETFHHFSCWHQKRRKHPMMRVSS